MAARKNPANPPLALPVFMHGIKKHVQPALVTPREFNELDMPDVSPAAWEQHSVVEQTKEAWFPPAV